MTTGRINQVAQAGRRKTLGTITNSSGLRCRHSADPRIYSHYRVFRMDVPICSFSLLRRGPKPPQGHHSPLSSSSLSQTTAGLPLADPAGRFMNAHTKFTAIPCKAWNVEHVHQVTPPPFNSSITPIDRAQMRNRPFTSVADRSALSRRFCLLFKNRSARRLPRYP